MDREAERGATAVLFADISGSVSLYEDRGDTVGFALNDKCLRIVESNVTGQGGRVIKRAGDAVLAAFDSAGSAVRAAAQMMKAVEAPASQLHAEGVHLRVGVSFGTVVHSEGDIYGDQVNVAARLVSLAGPEEVLISGPTYRALPEEMQETARIIDDVSLRGRSEPVGVFQFLWRLEDVTVTYRESATAPRAFLSLQFGSQSFAVDADRPSFRIGRGPDNDLVIPKSVVSRHHADIALRGGKFILKDRSTNGTDVHVENGPTLQLRREEIVLVGSGRIFFGGGDEDPLSYVAAVTG
jgi:class 3 adenylate cyclase